VNNIISSHINQTETTSNEQQIFCWINFAARRFYLGVPPMNLWNMPGAAPLLAAPPSGPPVLAPLRSVMLIMLVVRPPRRDLG
jgi:hypothetical protein